MLQCVWLYKVKIFDKKKTKQTDQMMRSMLMHASPMWREKKSTNAKVLGPKNKSKMKRRRAGVVHRSWDSLMTKWSGSQRWWETSKGWDSFVSTAEEICGTALKKDEDNVTEPSYRKDEKKPERR